MSAAAINTAPTPAAAGAAGQAGSSTGVGAAHNAQTSGLPAIFESMLATLTAAENGATPVTSSAQVKGASLTAGVGKVSENDDKTKAKDDDTDATATTTAVSTATMPPDAALALIAPAVTATPIQVAAATSANGDDDADAETANTLSAKTFGLPAGPAVTQVAGAANAADADKAKAAAALSADSTATNANTAAKADATIAATAAPAQPQAPAPAPTPAPVNANTITPQLPTPDPAAAAAAAAVAAGAKATAATTPTNAKAAAPKVAGADAPKPSPGASDLAVIAANANIAGKTADALAPIVGGASKAGAEDKESQAAAEAESDQPATTPTPADPATSATTTPATLAAAAAAPIVRGSPQTVANLSAEIVKKLDARSTQFDVQLDPAGLGKVDVRVQIGADGKMSAAMSFDTPQAAAELRSRSNELQQALAQSGFDVTGGMSFDVSTDRGQNGQAQNQQPDSGAAFRGKAFQAALDTTADTPPPAQLSSRRTSASGVDIRI